MTKTMLRLEGRVVKLDDGGYATQWQITGFDDQETAKRAAKWIERTVVGHLSTLADSVAVDVTHARPQ